MKNLISKKRTMGHLSILILALLLLQGTVECVEEEDEYLEKCCELGSSWAGQKLRCERFTGPVSGVPRDEQPACLETVDICCRKTFEEQGCELGKTDAKSGRACDSGDADFKGTPVGNYRRDCCEGCKLGILTGSSGKSCAIKKLSLGEPWDSTFKECCNEAKTGTSTTKASTTPIKTTLSSTISTTNLLSEFDDVDDDIDDFTDPNFSDDSNLDLCKLMKGLLCSEICVSTPGSYYCKCNKGSTLQADGRTCKSNITTTTSTTTTTTVAPTTTTKKSTTRSTSSTNVTKANVVTTPKFTTSKIPPKKTTTVKMLKTTAKPKTTTVKPTKKKIFTTTKLTTVKSITTNSTTSKPFKKTTKPLLPASTLRMLSTAAKSRTTRSVSTEDNELQNCPSGYRFNSITETCDDIDECADGSHNCGNQKCYNSPGSFQCAKAQVPVIRKKTSTTVSSNRSPGNCAVGSRYDTVRGGCVDINECEELEDACSSNEECVNNPGSFVCNCRLGFRRDELTQACVDVNECQLENDCLPSQRCDNTIGSYTCVRFLPCGTGYTLNAATEICEDDDECVMGTHDCGGGYHCRNTLGSYRCDKDRGKATTTQRTTTRRTTRPTLRTVFTTSTTPRTTTTTTTTPRPTTTRRPTTTTTTTTRRPTTTVTTTTRRPTTTTTTVRTRATTPRTTTRVITTTEAIPTVGTLTTITPRARSNVVNQRTNCPRGFEPGPVGQCIDIDECHRNLKMCGNQRCINTIGSFRCEPQLICGIGYAPDPVTGQCKDIDECARGIHKCGPKQTCENTQGGYMCYCPLGYEIGINHDCLDVDECTRVLPGSACGNNGRCINTPGSFKCICDSGFVNDPMGGCNDMDECKMNAGSCQHNCYNTWGGYKCGCKFGYRLNADNRTCDDVDECSEFKDNNLCIGICENTPGSYACKCPTGYRLTEDKRTCQDIDECAAGNTCVPGEICQNVRGGYRCNKIHCPPGYVRDRQRKNRCIRESPYCPIHDQACFQRPAHYTFNYIAIVSMYPIPAATGQVELFTMRGAYNLPGSTVRFSIAFIQTRAPPHVQPVTEECFALRKPFPSQAVLVMVKSLQGPQDIELEFSMEIYEPSGALAGSAVAKVFIVVTQYEF